MHTKCRCSFLTMLFIPILSGTICFSQGNSQFTIESYESFLSSHQNLTPDQLAALYDAGRFLSNTSANFSGAAYFDSIDAHDALTSGEKSLLGEHGFVVSDRLRKNSFGEAFSEIYHDDLPVFISTDAILHPLHMSWDAILKETELGILIPKLETLLTELHAQLPSLAAKYPPAGMKPSLNDVDVYLTVSLFLLDSATAAPAFSGDVTEVQELLALIKAEKPADYKLFSGNPRSIDFSQFTVRGHYTDEQHPELARYFRAMMWLGRTEMYLIAPNSADNMQITADIQRQTIDAVLVKEAADSADAFPLLEEIDGILRSFVGESDNVTLPNVQTLVEKTGLTNTTQLLDTTVLKKFQDTLKTESFAFQRILSQILLSDPMDPEKVQPASSFLLLGQRFIIDSYITGNVVYDKVADPPRMLPSTLDILFALGNDAAEQLLKPQLDQYHYAPNLAALRYLVDSYDSGFWQGTIYNGWLNSVRALNPPTDRTSLPPFMQTAAWWQEKMNTQLSSWAELRHDFILYGKQSYTMGITCSFPESYVEPIPEFFDAVKQFADGGAKIFQGTTLSNSRIVEYFNSMKAIADTLGGIARKELSGTALSGTEKNFLRTMLTLNQQVVCGGPIYNGWYTRLFYTGEKEGLMKKNFVVADVHTAPTDESGNPVGWVLHGGTGPINLAVVVADLPSGKTTAFIGPVMSYYECVTTNFKRLTDEEWQTAYSVAPSSRPDFVLLYLADSTGASHESSAPSLLTGVNDIPGNGIIPHLISLGQNYPNPFNSATVIKFSVPQALAGAHAELLIYNVQGQLVRRLLNTTMPAGNFAVSWNGTDERGITAASGVYFYHLVVGNQRAVGKMSFVK
ncbi:MAG: DUF3160 domain-containing protein [Bacteroidota bacterium]|nr:DUF3160 domain-containing protein [Bacteroidota bacterium]